jgi:segregation and condensation protein B
LVFLLSKDEPMSGSLVLYIEALIFIASEPISLKDIRKVLESAFNTSIPTEDIEQALAEIKEKYQQEHFAFEFVEIAEGFQFMTKSAFHSVVDEYIKENNAKRLSKAALETLAIIAYKQPVVKSEVEHIRGVNCDYTIQKLLEKELIEIQGRDHGPGKPLIYGTSPKFMNYFGLKSIKDLPQLKEFTKRDEEIGRLAEIEQSIKEEE